MHAISLIRTSFPSFIIVNANRFGYIRCAWPTGDESGDVLHGSSAASIFYLQEVSSIIFHTHIYQMAANHSDHRACLCKRIESNLQLTYSNRSLKEPKGKTLKQLQEKLCIMCMYLIHSKSKRSNTSNAQVPNNFSTDFSIFSFFAPGLYVISITGV